MHFGAGHEERAVGLGLHGIDQWLIEARPASPALKLRIRREQRQITGGTNKCSLALFFVERTASGALSAFLAQDHVLAGRKPLPPIHIGKFAIVDCFSGGHSLCPTNSNADRERGKRRTSSQ